MCEICHQSPCHPRCPYADEPANIGSCEKCGEPIFVEDYFAEIDGVYYCDNCLDNMSYGEIIELCGGEYRVATENDI